jgi:hypothetical protein
VGEGSSDLSLRYVAGDAGGVVGDDGARVAGFLVGPHGFQHVEIALVDEGFDVARHTAPHGAQVDVVNPSLAAQAADGVGRPRPSRPPFPGRR